MDFFMQLKRLHVPVEEMHYGVRHSHCCHCSAGSRRMASQAHHILHSDSYPEWNAGKQKL